MSETIQVIETKSVRVEGFRREDNRGQGQTITVTSTSEFAMLPVNRDHDARADFESTTRAVVKGQP